MPSKYEITRNAAEWLKTEVLASQPKYLAFLRTAANNYKYNFVEQLLIHEQKPDATACASIELWNQLGRWVNKGTHGIALLDTSSPRHRLRYVFDISDTNSYAGRTVSIWQMEFRHELAMMEALSDSFGIPREQMQSFPEFLEKTAEVLVEDNITDYLRDLTLNTKGSLLEDLDEFNIEVELRRTMRSSITYMLLTRCGYDPSIYEDYLDFSHIRDFDTPDVATILGNAVSDVSEMALREIGVTVRALEKAERTQNRTFAENRFPSYDVAGSTNNQPETERSDTNDQSHLHSEGRLFDPRPGSAGGPENREVRNDAPSVPAEPSSGDLRRDAPERDAERALGADRPAGQRDDGAPNLADGTDGGRDGAVQGERPDGLGRPDERDQGSGRGDRDAGADLRVDEETPPADDDLPSEEEQQNRIAEAEVEQASAFVISQEDIDAVLLGGSHISEGKYRIYTQFLKQEPAADNIRFLKNEYGIGGAYPAVVGREISEDHDGKGIRLRLGKITEPDAELLLTWAKVEKRIRELIRDDRYLNQAERESYPAWQRKQAAQADRAQIAEAFLSVVRDYNDFQTQLGNTGALLNQYVLSDCAHALTIGEKTTRTLSGSDYILPLMRDALRQIISENTHLTDRCNEVLEALNRDVVKPLEPTYDELNPPPEPPKEYRFSLGDTVYLGAQQYELLFLGADEVRLYDPTFPLLNKELSREEFDRMVAENPLNDGHLQVIEVVKPEAVSDNDFLERAKAVINEYAQREFGQDADYTDLHAVDLAFTTVSDADVPVQASVDLLEYHLDRYVSGVLIERRSYDSLEDLISKELEYLDFDALTDFTDDQIAEAEEKRASQEWEEAHEPEAEAEYLPGDILQIGADDDVPEYRVITTRRVASDENNLPVTMYGFVAYWDRELQHEKLSNTARLPVNQPIKVIERTLAARLVDFFHTYQPEENPPRGEASVFRMEEDLRSNGKITDLIGLIELIVPESVVTNEGKAEADQLLREMITLLPENLRYTVFGDNLSELERLGFPIPPREELDGMRQDTVFAPVAQELAAKAESQQSRADEMIQQALLAAELSERTGQNVFAFEEGNPNPVNLPKSETPPVVEPTQAEETSLAPPMPVKRQSLRPTVLHPEIKNADRHDFQITVDDLGVGTPTERYFNNVTAIRLLKKLEAEGRLATPEEQVLLSRYVGWGGLASCFEETSSHYLELKGLLTEDEYAAARESTLTAFFTPPVVIRGIYQAMEQMGFQRGNILEPSCGIGNFMGMLPASMQDSRLYGVELDSISGRIAQQLYQKASIAVQGFEATDLPDSFFDASIGNVPFGQFKVLDKRYDKHNFLIHDYFFAKALDKVRPGGVIAFITSKGTLDKENPAVRKYIAQRADLLGAIRLPNDTFKKAAGTDVTSDIIFLQKRDRLIDQEPDWVHLDTDPNGVRMNRYFVDHPEMILGEMKVVSGPFGPDSACVPYEDQALGDLLSAAVQNIHADYTAIDLEEVTDEEADLTIPADPSVRNYSYTLVDGKLYYRQNSIMKPVDVSLTGQNRIKGMIGIRDSVRKLIEYQTEDFPEEMITREREELNRLYDSFVASYGILNARANKSVFADDNSASLLSSLEVLDDEGKFIRKADMFTRRTIKQRVVITAVDTASEALALSLAEKAKVDMDYMMQLTGKTEAEIVEDLEGVIFLNPLYGFGGSGGEKYLPTDEYLSGNVREKLAVAKRSAELSPADYRPNVEALERVQPVDLTASEISVRLGATWLPPEIVEQFMFYLLSTPRYCQWNIKVRYSQYTGEWNIEGKSYDRGNVKANSTYGTSRINAYKIIEQTLNLRDVKIFDYFEDDSGRKIAVLNRTETAIAQGKQALIKEAFAEWIWQDPNRRQKLCKLYNEKFNSNRPREYDGSHLSFVGINPEIQLRPHQVNAIAHILYGGNTLLAHVVGAGKTFEMVAAAQELKRLGLCHKSLIVVPNHLTEQWAAEYLQLYPAANILVATRKSFETKNRKRFCGRIATGDYDAVIIGHSQFEKIPMSVEWQTYMLQQQIEEIVAGIAEAKRNRGDNFTVKQLEKAKKSAEAKLKKLNDQSRKDDVVTFEELGIDRIFVDEAHYFKNLAAFSKMRNVGGISQTEAQKSSDLYMKCRYLDELTGGRGVVFATGTPISNSMVEMYTMQKYLQYNALDQQGLLHFDAWASTFGETVTAIELAPEGSGYRSKTRFARFYNLPELMSMFKTVADIQTADMLKLPVPKANYHNIVLKPSQTQKDMVAGLSERAEKVRNKMVSSDEDNMLLITNDGRKLALDQRLMNEMLPDHESSKVSACANNVFEIWQRTADQRSTQMVFCDLSTPHNDGKFNVYDDLKKKLTEKGIPEEEIAFIHSAGTEEQKKELFGKVRNGQIRVLIGSTQKMGAGTNVQQKLIALHHVDCPWRPSDLQQREGRIIRQGNENPEVEIYTYVTEATFDSYLYQLVESKQKFIGQIMTSKSPVRSAEDIDEQALSYAEIKALCTGNPYIKEKMDLDIEVSRLKLLKANHLSQRYALEDQIIHHFPKEIRALEQKVEGYTYDIGRVKVSTHPNEDGFSPMVIEGTRHSDKKAAGSAILEVCKSMTSPDPIPLGSYRGFDMELYFDTVSREYKITLIGSLRHVVPLGTDIFGNIQRLDNTLDGLQGRLDNTQAYLENTRQQLEEAKVAVTKPFPHEADLASKSARLAELNAMLDMDKPENEIVDSDRGDDDTPQTPSREQSR